MANYDYPDHRYADSPLGELVDINRAVPAFVPHPLPTHIDLPPSTRNANGEALIKLGELNAVFLLEPEPELLVPSFVRVEAVSSSRIEGTRSNETDLYVFDATAKPRTDDEIVRNYERALAIGAEHLKRDRISLDLVLEMHQVLMEGEGYAHPGEFRETQVHIGPPGRGIAEATHVPPPPELIPDLMDDWESWLHSESGIDLLARVAMMHWQFEAIHPFTDGNGRMGRLLILLFLMHADALGQPLLYVSRWLEAHRADYYEHLAAVTETGDWIPWAEFFIEGVREQAVHAAERGIRLSKLRTDIQRRVREAGGSANALLLAGNLFRHPIISRRMAAELTGVTPAGSRVVVQKLVGAGILRRRPSHGPALFEAPEILDLLT